jgi:hypothetical protein
VLDNGGNLTVSFDQAPMKVDNITCFSEYVP